MYFPMKIIQSCNYQLVKKIAIYEEDLYANSIVDALSIIDALSILPTHLIHVNGPIPTRIFTSKKPMAQ